jgi:hypothetical protein
MKIMKTTFFRFRQTPSGIRTTVLLLFLFLGWGADEFFDPSLATAQSWRQATDKRIIRQRIRQAIAVQNKHTKRWLRMDDVVGTGTGIGSDGRPVISVFSRRIGVPGIPREVDGIPVRVEFTGMFIAQNDPRDRLERPVPIGVSSGHPDVTAGTIGARVIDADGNVYALSNNHVYANQNDANIGDSILQPGSFDGGIDPADKIGELFEFQQLKFYGNRTNTLDAAIASTTINEVGRSTLPEGYGMPSSIIFGDRDANGFFDDTEDLLGLAVQKFGRTTGLTHGNIAEINVTISVCYENCDSQITRKSALFIDQVRIVGSDNQIFSTGGDSGSLIITDDPRKKVVALLFAGSDTSTLANRIDLVLDRFNVSIDGASIEEICESDFDRDGDVDAYDLSVFMEFFPLDMDADLNDDGILSIEDLQRMAGDFGRDDCP